MEKIGAGGCGAVYEVTHVKRKNFAAALKVNCFFQCNPVILK